MPRDIPIIFSGPMVRALLDGGKTQTRRLASSPLAKVRPGDRLWVRECGNWSKARGLDGSTANFFCYAADADPSAFGFFGGKKRPSIHMPRWASRLTLVVEEVRTVPLQAISEDDAWAEGVDRLPEVIGLDGESSGWNKATLSLDGHSINAPTAREVFAMLWRHLHGDASWDANPEVAALTFRVHRSNVDAMQLAEAA